MNSATRLALNRINRRFYRDHAVDFSDKRSRPWPGWTRVLESVVPNSSVQTSAGHAIRILDVGCGNGRFAQFVASQISGSVSYVGVDSSEELLRIAGARLTNLPGWRVELIEADVAAGVSIQGLEAEPFDLVAVFGVLHHIPGFESRASLLKALERTLGPSGRMALSYWQFATLPRFQKRIVPWSRFNVSGEDSIDMDQLDSSDYLLAWGPIVPDMTDSIIGLLRYCHHASDRESEELVESLSLRVIDRFRSDGAGGGLNLYQILAKDR